MKFEIYREGGGGLLGNALAGLGTKGQYRWRLWSDNHEIIASGEDYVNKADCQNAINLVKGTNALTRVEDNS
ncbi:YegP family protein [Pseudomonas sp. CGJS7]|uniref:YegP family protein n=1 Tax=Pseudomonas sp. CGJS7 TaxID=3109348 RepID=UPI003009EE81